jgi:hypothetical protein
MLHVHDTLALLYGHHDPKHLHSASEVDGYIDTHAHPIVGDLPPDTDDVTTRKTLYSAYDLAAYSQQRRLSVPDAPSFMAAALTIGTDPRTRQRLDQWRLTEDWQSLNPERHFLSCPYIGVITQVMVKDTQGRQTMHVHAVTLVEVATPSGSRRKFAEVDSQRDPRDVDATKTRTFEANDILDAFNQLLPKIAPSTLGGYTVDLYCPTPETLQRAPRPLPSLPPPPVRPAVQVARLTETARSKRVSQQKEKGAVRSKALRRLAQRPPSPPPRRGVPRLGVQKPGSDWIAQFLSDDVVPKRVHEHARNPPPGSNTPLVKHYAHVLWQQLGHLAHPLHFPPELAEQLSSFGKSFPGDELLVTFASPSSGSQPSRDNTIVLRRDSGGPWNRVTTQGKEDSLDAPLASWLTQQLESADADGLRLLRMPPQDAEWMSRLPQPGETASKEWNEELRRDGFNVWDDARTGFRPELSDANVENLLMSQLARGVLKVPGKDKVVIQDAIIANRRWRHARELELDTLEEQLDRHPGDRLRSQIASKKAEIRYGRRPHLEKIVLGIAPTGVLPIDVNEFALMLPRALQDSEILKAAARPRTSTRSRPLAGADTPSGAGHDAPKTMRTNRWATDVRSLPHLIRQFSPEPLGERWNREGGDTLLHARNCAVQNEHQKYVLGHPDKPNVPVRVALSTAASTTLKEIERQAAPYSPNPLRGSLVIQQHVQTMKAGYTKLYANGNLGLAQWAQLKMSDYLASYDPDASIPSLSLGEPSELELTERMSKGLAPEDVSAAEQGVETLKALVSAGSVSFSSAPTVLSGYLSAIRHLRTTIVMPGTVRDETIIPNADLKYVLREYHLDEGGTYEEQRTTLRLEAEKSAKTPEEIRRHPLCGAIDIWRRLPRLLRTHQLAGTQANARKGLRYIEPNLLVMDSERLQQPRFLASHVRIKHAAVNRGDAMKHMLNLAMEHVEWQWTKENRLDLREAAKDIDSVPGLRARLRLNASENNKQWLAVVNWLGDNSRDEDVDGLLLQANREILTQFMGQLSETEAERDEIGAVVLAWMERREREVDNLQFNPVESALDAAVDVSEDQFVAEFDNVDRLSAVQQRGLRSLHAWNLTSKQDPDASNS